MEKKKWSAFWTKYFLFFSCSLPSDIDLSELESLSRVAGGQFREDMLEVYTGWRPDSVETDQPRHLSSKLVVLNPFNTRLVGSPGFSPGKSQEKKKKKQKGQEKREKIGREEKLY